MHSILHIQIHSSKLHFSVSIPLIIIILIFIFSPSSSTKTKISGLPIKIIQFNTILEQFSECAIVLRGYLDRMNLEFEPFHFPVQYSSSRNRAQPSKAVTKHLPYFRKRVYCSVNVYFGLDKKSSLVHESYPTRKSFIDFPFEYPSYVFIFLSEDNSRNALSILQSLVKYARQFFPYVFTVKENKSTKGYTVPTTVVNLKFVCQFCVIRSPKEMHQLLIVKCNTSFEKCKHEMIEHGKQGLRKSLWDQRPKYNCSTHNFSRKFQHPPNDYEYFVKTIPCLLQLNQSVLSHNWNSDISINFKPLSIGSANSFQISVDTISFNFITCDGVRYPDLSLLVFTDPFDTTVWISILAMFCISVGAAFFMNMQENPTKHLKLIITLYLNLIEQGISTNSEIYLSKIKLGNYMFGLWLISGVILTNAYKGLVVSLLTSPPQPTLELFELEHLENYTFYSSITKIAESSPSREAKTCLPDPRFKINLCNSKGQFATSSELGKILDIYLKNSDEGSKQKAASKIYNNMVLYFEANVTLFLQKIASCNKTAFSHNTKILPKFLNYFEQNNPNKKYTFFQGKKEFGSSLMSWTATDFPVSVPYDRLNALFHSGIMKHWEYWRLLHQFNKTKIDDLDDEPLSVENLHIQTIFYIFLAFTFVSAVAFLGEVIIGILQE